MVQVQLRLAQETVEGLDEWVEDGRFKSRSDAIRSIIAIYEEREETRKFYNMLIERSQEAKDKPEILIPLEDL